MSFDIFTIVLIFCAGLCSGIALAVSFIGKLERETSLEEGGDWHD